MNLKRTLGCLLPAALLAIGCGGDDDPSPGRDAGVDAISGNPDAALTPGVDGSAPPTDTATLPPADAAPAPGLVDISSFPAAMTAGTWSPAVWFRAEEANPPLYNQLRPLALNPQTGAPTAQTPFIGPAAYFQFTPAKPWQGNAVPAYIVPTNYVGAFAPGQEPWTMGWTVGIHGNKDVWNFASDAAGTALAGKSAPSVQGTCPAGTTKMAMTFAAEYGALNKDETGMFTGAAAAGDYKLCELAPTYTTAGTIKLTNDNVYMLPNAPGSLVGTGADQNAANDVAVTLEIEPGTLIIGKRGASLIITRGSKIMAVGTKANPIVLTSDDQVAARFDGNAATDPDTGRQEWGGLVLVGQARDNRCRGGFDNCQATIEGLPGVYGAGSKDDDNSGELRYVVVRNGGSAVETDKEINGITFYATGSGTKAEYLQVHKNSDDGVEFFGSTTSVAHLALTDNGDDSFDWGHGFTGSAQFVFIRQAQDEGDRFIEADNDPMIPDSAPVSFPQLANFTAIGPAAGFVVDREKSGGGMILRRGTKAQLWNFLFHRAAKDCVDIDDAGKLDTFKHVANPKNPGTDLTIRHSILDCMKPFNIE